MSGIQNFGTKLLSKKRSSIVLFLFWSCCTIPGLRFRRFSNHFSFKVTSIWILYQILKVTKCVWPYFKYLLKYFQLQLSNRWQKHLCLHLLTLEFTKIVYFIIRFLIQFHTIWVRSLLWVIIGRKYIRYWPNLSQTPTK